MALLDILACPICHVKVVQENDYLRCTNCNRTFPIMNGVPIMLPDGSVPDIMHESELNIRPSYDPWVHRVILQSLLDDQVVLEVGSGNMAMDDPCIIRMDMMLTPYVDIVADVHELPFLPGSLDYIFSLAVFEHLRDPFLAARGMYNALKDGGYIYHECNFVFAYHGYPHHYFNASMEGMKQIFSEYYTLKQGVAPYQMPSHAIEMVVGTYLKYSHANEYGHGKELVKLLKSILDQDLMQYDVYFSQAEAQNVAAGTYYCGMKRQKPDATIIPDVIYSTWEVSDDLREAFPSIFQLTTVNNILIWARHNGADRSDEIADYFVNLVPFNKRGGEVWDRTEIRNWPYIEPSFGDLDKIIKELNTEFPTLDKSFKNQSKTNIPPQVAKKWISMLKNSCIGDFIKKIGNS